ncbi:hypothetical protein ZOSMA_95G00520 [Zostera marina]|uniref:Uncharacterized protein n=1 Tax=Zostera marina TaxID=29655 RepID=A0A0K9NK36_ZOSMR|nr:hypothetical protein ZOSMA_95G00520 [Zostera marina]
MEEDEGGGGEISPAVRLVRCPKCGKLLSEVTGFKIYRCGGCNATLQATKSRKPATAFNVDTTDSDLKPTGSPASRTDSNDYKPHIPKQQQQQQQQEPPQISSHRRPSKKVPAAFNSTSNFDNTYYGKGQRKVEVDDEGDSLGRNKSPVMSKSGPLPQIRRPSIKVNSVNLNDGHDYIRDHQMYNYTAFPVNHYQNLSLHHQQQQQSSRNDEFRPRPRAHSYSSPWSGSQYSSYSNQKQNMAVTRNRIRRRNQCLPLLGGAPFIMCHACFTILNLSRNLLSMVMCQKRLKCGSCSRVIKLKVTGNKLLTFAPAKKTNTNERTIIQPYLSNPMRSSANGGVKKKEKEEHDWRSDMLEDKIHASSSGISKEDDNVNGMTLPLNEMKLIDEEEEEEEEEEVEEDPIPVSYRVYINGHPIPDEDVKKAEKLAGTVEPGNYWYDYQAGFWGTMGKPCLGIILPNIEEFNYPMARKCAEGNTDVVVNGRELHQTDLYLLANRGLPTTRGKSYTIEISGRVVDADSGEELTHLGKLAPTIERLNRGLGMLQPSTT